MFIRQAQLCLRSRHKKSLDHIEYMESARSHVFVRDSDREYLVRDTMAGLLDKLADGQFARSHRELRD
jgi:DNA-binding LytR/AlgR family response regulator